MHGSVCDTCVSQCEKVGDGCIMYFTLPKRLSENHSFLSCVLIFCLCLNVFYFFYSFATIRCTQELGSFLSLKMWKKAHYGNYVSMKGTCEMLMSSETCGCHSHSEEATHTNNSNCITIKLIFICFHAAFNISMLL